MFLLLTFNPRSLCRNLMRHRRMSVLAALAGNFVASAKSTHHTIVSTSVTLVVFLVSFADWRSADLAG